jgi:hypothetical protein
MNETKQDIAREIAEIVDGVDPTVYDDNAHGVYFDRGDLSALKRWIAENDDSLPGEENNE